MSTTFTVLGTTDEQDVCDRCGKLHLVMVVALRTSDGDVVKYGRSCAARALGVTSASLGRKAAQADVEIRDARYVVHNFGPFADGHPGALALFRNRNRRFRCSDGVSRPIDAVPAAEIVNWSRDVVDRARRVLADRATDAGDWTVGLVERNTNTARYEPATRWPL